MCEDEDDWQALNEAALALDTPGLRVIREPTPLTSAGKYSVVPYSNKINWALRHIGTDLIVYLDNNSMPHPAKYARMYDALKRHPKWGAVYCSQQRIGMHNVTLRADKIVEDAYCGLNYTQVMHRMTDDRWELDLDYADPDLIDGMFWRSLHESLGAFHPVPQDEDEALDIHFIDHPKAQGL